MNSFHSARRSGISLLEVLISVGVIALGIFGVASLIPVAQFKIAEGTSKDRQAAFGPNAVAQFRIHDMGAPDNWVAPVESYMFDNGQLKRRGYCIDPLGLVENADGSKTRYASNVTRFPANIGSRSDDGAAIYMPRIGLKSLTYGLDKAPGGGDDPSPAAELALARNVFFLQDELVFQRPSESNRQPNRQYFVLNQRPVRSFSSASLSWFATISPTVIVDPSNPSQTLPTDEFLLSIVVVKDRVPTAAATEENYAKVDYEFAGEIRLTNSRVVTDAQMKLSDLRNGDWLLLTKPVGPEPSSMANDPSKRVYRWTQIIGTSDEGTVDEDGYTPDQRRRFTVTNDDFIGPSDPGGYAIFARGIVVVYERTIRLGNTSAWN